MSTNKRTRKTIRMPEFDYCSPGKYFVTICTFMNEPLLGKFENNRIILSGIGKIVAECWTGMERIYEGIKPETYIIMPNHFHGIISIIKQNDKESIKILGFPDVIRNFKAFTSHEYYTKEFNNKLWQRGYFEHIIRDEKQQIKIERYINNNPATWLRDKYHLV